MIFDHNAWSMIYLTESKVKAMLEMFSVEFVELLTALDMELSRFGADLRGLLILL